MKVKDIMRNRITGFLFGKYNVGEIARSIMIKDEELVSSFENIFYRPDVLLIDLVSLGMVVVLSALVSPFFLALIPIQLWVVSMSMELEIVFLSNERVFIEKRGLIEKILGVRNVRVVSLEQIAIISYTRAPVNGYAILSALLLAVPSGIALYLGDSMWVKLAAGTILILAGYILWFGLRLTQRSIELNVIGVNAPVGLGRKKGAPIYFLLELQELVFERIHHYEGEKRTGHVETLISEFPLQYSADTKRIIAGLHSHVEKEIIRLLSEESTDFEGLVERIDEFNRQELEEGLRSLKQKELIRFDSSERKWVIIPPSQRSDSSSSR